MSSGRKRLRLERGDGSSVKEYRIENGIVEARTLDPNGQPDPQTGSDWQQLTPDQLAVHVERNTVVAQWLRRRLGWERLLCACITQEPTMQDVVEDQEPPGFLSSC
ncbi:MAG TPA: hypothetical protein VJK29_11040 [Terriglobales bacterium]|nr:hypothetical protein [Terriglobales bacterium]